MTDTERMTLEQWISQGLEFVGYPGAWDPAEYCPQGHPNNGYDEDDDLRRPIGTPCFWCCQEYVKRIVHTARPPEWLAAWKRAMAQWAEEMADPQAHLEWRIGKAPKRWTQDLPSLLAALEWLWRERAWQWDLHATVQDGPGNPKEWVAHVWSPHRTGFQVGPPDLTAPEVLAQALLQVFWEGQVA